MDSSGGTYVLQPCPPVSSFIGTTFAALCLHTAANAARAPIPTAEQDCKRLNVLSKPLRNQAHDEFEQSGDKQRLFDEFFYAAGTWEKQRRVIVKAEHTARGSNPRYIVTNLAGSPQHLYDAVYCARGDMENRIKEQQLHLFADRTSCHQWWPNQYRVLLSALAYVLLNTIRRIALAGTELARAYVGTIRLKLLKIALWCCVTPDAFSCCCPALIRIRSCSFWPLLGSSPDNNVSSPSVAELAPSSRFARPDAAQRPNPGQKHNDPAPLAPRSRPLRTRHAQVAPKNPFFRAPLCALMQYCG